MKEKITVCIPTWNGSKTIAETIRSILNQTFRDFELVVVDNASTDRTSEVVKTIKDPRIKIYRNKTNLGCGGNLEECKRKAKGDIIFYLSDDDLIDKETLNKVYAAFQLSPDIGIVTRPYYWFSEDVNKPVRLTKQFDSQQIVSIKSPFDKIRDVIATSDQISGIAFRKKFMEQPFQNERFVEMASGILPMLKDCKAVILKDNIVAIRTYGNGYRGGSNSLVFQKSPMMAWYGLITSVYFEKKYYRLKQFLVREFIANNYIGLVQIKNWGSYLSLFKEIYYLIKLRWFNILNLKFWFFSLGTIFTPRFLLNRMVVVFKNQVNSQFLKQVGINL